MDTLGAHEPQVKKPWSGGHSNIGERICFRFSTTSFQDLFVLKIWNQTLLSPFQEWFVIALFLIKRARSQVLF